MNCILKQIMKKGEVQMINKIKFIGFLIVIVILFQMPFLIKYNQIYPIFNMFFAIIVWLIGSQKIRENTKFNKKQIYIFIILWSIFITLISYCIWGKYLRNFSIFDANWKSSVVLLFALRKILSLKVIQEKIEYDSEKSNKIIIISLAIGLIIYGIWEYLSNYVIRIYWNYNEETILYYINVCVFIISLFSILKSEMLDKKFIIISIVAFIIITFIINIIPIIKINSIIKFQKDLRANIELNYDSYTYKTLKEELKKYLPEETIDYTKLETKTWDYQQYDIIKEMGLGILQAWTQDVTKQNFKNVLQSVQNFTTVLDDYIGVGEKECNNRLTAMIISWILVSSFGSYTIIRKKISA